MNAVVQVKLGSPENACYTWAPYSCVHDEALYKSTFIFSQTLHMRT